MAQSKQASATKSSLPLNELLNRAEILITRAGFAMERAKATNEVLSKELGEIVKEIGRRHPKEKEKATSGISQEVWRARIHLQKMGWSYRKAGPVLGCTYAHLCYVLTGKRVSASLVERVLALTAYKPTIRSSRSPYAIEGGAE